MTEQNIYKVKLNRRLIEGSTMAATARQAQVQYIILIIFLFFPFSAFSTPSNKTGNISPALAADYIHAVIEADRTVYSEYIVERLGETISLRATENWKKDNTLLLPAQFLLESSNISMKNKNGVQGRLLSLWPINKNNSPKTSQVKKAMEAVANNPKKTYTWQNTVKGIKYFHAVYPDIAVSKSCASCHNAHPASPRRDFKKGDVLGGILISIPLGKATNIKSAEKSTIPAEVVAGYVHSILAADRTVYAKHIVNRLQNNNIIYASENWWEENTLLLPAQFLLNATELIKNSILDLDVRLISLWPINKANGVCNDFERQGLEAVAKNPESPYTHTINLGGKQYFQAIYPDKAVTQACVSCHNTHPQSPKHDFQLHGVRGGIVVTMPTNGSE